MPTIRSLIPTDINSLEQSSEVLICIGIKQVWVSARTGDIILDSKAGFLLLSILLFLYEIKARILPMYDPVRYTLLSFHRMALAMT